MEEKIERISWRNNHTRACVRFSSKQKQKQEKKTLLPMISMGQNTNYCNKIYYRHMWRPVFLSHRTLNQRSTSVVHLIKVVNRKKTPIIYIVWSLMKRNVQQMKPNEEFNDLCLRWWIMKIYLSSYHWNY